MAKRPTLSEHSANVNIMPLMNIIMLLIPFLIMSTEFLKVGAIDVASSKVVGPDRVANPSEQPKNPLNLTVQIHQQGFTVLTKSKKLPLGCDFNSQKKLGKQVFPTIKKTLDGQYNFDALHRCLKRIKRVFPKERKLIVMSDPGMPYHLVIGVMDASRAMFSGKKGNKREELFPVVFVSAGVV